MTVENYPRIAELIGAWFHQDYDLAGETVEEIVAAYREVTPPREQTELRDEIARFLAEHPNETGAEFDRMFAPGVIVSLFFGSTRLFLERICRLLEDLSS